MTARGPIVGADRSGTGKTSLAIGLMRAFARAGLAVRGVKSGPDYIDPGYHRAATGHPGVNLDSWAMAPRLLDRLAGRQAAGADLVVVESAMGLFDGIPAAEGRSGAALFDGEGRSLGPAGARRGHVTGTFFHAIAQG